MCSGDISKLGGLIHISNITRGGFPANPRFTEDGPQVSHIPKGSSGLINFNTGSDPAPPKPFLFISVLV